MYHLLRPLLFQLSPETAHSLTLRLLRLAGDFAPTRHLLAGMFTPPIKPTRAFGLEFKNPLGLAAGYDKDCHAIRGLAALGFGHLELGTITPRAQPGNPQPRLFRLPQEQAVINRMGFPGQGMEAAIRRLRGLSRPYPAIVGLNLGKNKDTPLQEAAQDYLTLLRGLAPYADYFTINISSPNTVGLRRLQGREMLEGLLGALAKERQTASLRVPILVKIAPDVSDDELDDAVGAILDAGMDGIVATNTTLSRDGVRSALRAEAGGLSGKPLTGLADSVLAKVVERVKGQVPVVGVGGIISPQDARKKLDLGATLVQVYTGLIYRGPGLVKEIVRGL